MVSSFIKHYRTISNGKAIASIASIPWDSTLFHNTTIECILKKGSRASYTTLLSSLPTKLHLTKGDLIVSYVKPFDRDAISALIDAGSVFMEQAVTVSIDLMTWDEPGSLPDCAHIYIMKEARPKDLKTVKAIASTTFGFDRFHLDPLIPQSLADKRYEQWIENSWQNHDIIQVLSDIKGIIYGFAILSQTNTKVNLRLAGIAPKFKGRGIGKILYHTMLSQLKKRKVKVVTARISSNNTPVLNVYTSISHPKFIDNIYIFHRHIQ